MTGLRGKLQLRPEQSIACFECPEALRGLFDFADTAATGAVIGFCQNQADVARLVPLMLAMLRPDGLLWLGFRKGKAGAANGLTRDTGWQALTSRGYDTVRAISIDADWSGLRFRHSSET